MALRQVLLLSELAGLVSQVDAAAPQADQGGAAALPQVDEVGKGTMPGLQHHCLPQAVDEILPGLAYRQSLSPFA